MCTLVLNKYNKNLIFNIGYKYIMTIYDITMNKPYCIKILN